MSEAIIELLRQISAERDPEKVLPLIKQLRKTLAEEQSRLEAEISKRKIERSGLTDSSDER